jgi:sugar (pentulose or hexulose) kinase
VILGLDVGGTYLKAGWLQHGRATGVQRAATPAFIDPSGPYREIDPSALMNAVHALLARFPDPTAILITGQMSGCTFVDDAGNALVPLITWQDRRTSDVAPIAEALGSTAVVALGNELRPDLPIAALAWPQTPPTGLFTSLIGYVAGQLAGQAAQVAHPSDAAASGMWSLADECWLPEALQIAGLQPEQMPAVDWALTAVGRNPSGAPVFAPIGDQQASLLGAGLRPEGRALLSMNIATGGQVSVVDTAASKAQQVASRTQIRPFFDGSYLRTFTHLPSGRALTKVLELLSRRAPTDDDWAWAMQACAGPHSEQQPTNPLPTWDPRFFTGEGGQLSGVTASTTSADCMVAAVATLAQGFVAAADDLGGRTCEELVFSGGLVQKFTPLRNAILRYLDLPHTVHPGDDAALDGLAVLAEQPPQ